MKIYTFVIPLLAVLLLAAASACAPNTPNLEATKWNLLQDVRQSLDLRHRHHAQV